MADLAFVFHWPPAVMDQMTVPELMMWHTKAHARIKAKNEAGQP